MQVIGGPISQLARCVVAPALHSAAIQHGACAKLARSEVRNSRTQPVDIDRSEAVDACAVAEFAVAVVAPAGDSACLTQCARVGVSRATILAGS